MKIALISDIHGNVPALEAVLEDLASWGPDRVVVNGDVVNRGPRSREVLDMVLAAADPARWVFTRGNHEDYVLEYLSAPAPGIRFEINRLASWTRAQLGDLAAPLGDWPLQVELPDGLRCTHASMKGNRDGIYPFSDDETIRAQIAPPPAVFATAHVHWPYVRSVDQTLVVNSGSVGSPADGDVRASYARLVRGPGGWSADIQRLSYDRRAARQAFEDTGFLDDSGPVSRIIFEEWQRAFPMVGRWFAQYAQAVEAGEIGLEAAVDRFLAQEDRTSSTR